MSAVLVVEPRLPAALAGDDPSSGARWVSQLARALHPVPAHASGAEAQQLLREHPVWLDPGVDLGALPVLLVGGLASTPDSLELLRQWLLRAGARLSVPPIRYGVDCGERTTRDVAAHVRQLAESTGRPCVLLAHSRGGHFARAVAVRHPELVSTLVTLGTPINRMLAVRAMLRAELAVLATLGTLGVPGLMGTSCLWGACCRQLRADLRAPLPVGLPYLAVYSRHDEVVDWRSCLDPAARHREVRGSHSGMLCSPEVLEVLAAELGGLTGTAGHPTPAPYVGAGSAST